jgi:hypothetical protein
MESTYTTPSSTPNILLAAAARNNEVISLIRRIKEAFELHFDRSWLAIVIDELPMDKRVVREIRNFLPLTDMTPENRQQIESGIDNLRRYIATLKIHLLPNIKELLGVSAFSSSRRGMDKSQYVLRRLTAHALPHNLTRLETLVDTLENLVNLA